MDKDKRGPEEDAGEVTSGYHKSSDTPESIWDIQLQEGQIRLFNIQLDGSDQIRGALEVFDLKSAPEYIAQSYVCGEGDCDTEIIVNGSSHYIKPNLSIALHQTKKALQERKAGRRVGTWKRTSWLWIDAVCIKQNDARDLGLQIPLMEHIYKSQLDFRLRGIFEKVNVKDEGPTNSHQTHISDDALSMPSDHEQQLRAESGIGEEDLQVILAKLKAHQSGQSSDVESTSQALSYLHPFWQACIRFFDAEWFRRLWTYQELLLSRHLLVTLQSCVTWRRLRAMYTCLRGGLNNKRSTEKRDNHPIGYHSVASFLLRHTLQNSPFRRVPVSRGNVWSLIVITAQRRAQIPKDHVFAVLGLMDASIRDRISVDYSKTDAQVFEEMVKLALETSEAAWRLPRAWEDFAWVPATTPGLPSWCPDLNNETNARVGWFSGRRIPQTVSDAFLSFAQLHVSQDSELVLRVLELDTVLQLSADACPAWVVASPVLSKETHVFSVEHATLIWIGCLRNAFSGCLDDLPAVTVRLQNFLEFLIRPSTERLAALMCLLVASQLLTDGLTLNEVVSHVRQSLDPEHELRQEILEKLNAEPDHKSLALALAWIAHVLRDYFGGSYVFTTANGSMGLSPKPVSAGDRICIAPGGNLLHVFSTVPKRYVTCAVVFGLMDENLLSIAREPGRYWQDILVR